MDTYTNNTNQTYIKPSLTTVLLGMLTLGDYNRMMIENNCKYYQQKHLDKLKHVSLIVKSH